MAMTAAEHEFWTDRVAHYLNMGIVLDAARAMADDDLDLWREYGDDARFDQSAGDEDDDDQED